MHFRPLRLAFTASLLSLGSGLSLCPGLASAALVASLADDFSIANGNPNGNWRYGYTPSLNAGYTLTLLTQTNTNGPFQSFSGPGANGTPLAGKNTSNATFLSGTMAIPANAFAMHPGPAGEIMVARYTVPRLDAYEFSAAFRPADSVGGYSLKAVYVNGMLWGGGNGSLGTTFRTPSPRVLNVGDTIDFALGPNGDNAFDTFSVSALITAPEPTSALALALIGSMLRRRR